MQKLFVLNIMLGVSQHSLCADLLLLGYYYPEITEIHVLMLFLPEEK